jgi:hypothetical protein
VILHNARHCEERLGLEDIAMQLLFHSESTSDEAISLHRLTDERFLQQLQKPLYCEPRARRLLRGCSNDRRSKGLEHPQLNLAMTSMAVMV